MAYGNVPHESPGNIAQSARYNQLVDNVDDLDTRLDVTEALTTNTSGAVGTGNQRLSDRLGAGVTNANTASSQLSALQTLTTDTATNGGQGNARLADRFGTGVGTGANVVTGSASSQLTDLRSRATALEGKFTNSSITKYVLGADVTIAVAGPTNIISQAISVPTASNEILVIGNIDVSVGATNIANVNPAAGTNVLYIELTVDGVAQTPQIIFGTKAETRSSVSQTWSLDNLSAASHTLVLRFGIAGAATPPTYTARATHTGLTVVINSK